MLDTMNIYGTRLLNMCKATGLPIVNGRHANGRSNEFTFYGANAMSVIDYSLAPYNVFDII